jgi:hypothetical protein
MGSWHEKRGAVLVWICSSRSDRTIPSKHHSLPANTQRGIYTSNSRNNVQNCLCNILTLTSTVSELVAAAASSTMVYRQPPLYGSWLIGTPHADTLPTPPLHLASGTLHMSTSGNQYDSSHPNNFLRARGARSVGSPYYSHFAQGSLSIRFAIHAIHAIYYKCASNVNTLTQHSPC